MNAPQVTFRFEITDSSYSYLALSSGNSFGPFHISKRTDLTGKNELLADW